MKRTLMIMLVITSLLAVLFAMACVPPPQNWGCSPGFWKNHTGAQYWGPIPTDAQYNLAFATPVVPGLTLLGALQLKGGGENAAARMNVAGLLNTYPGTWCPGE